MTSTKTVYQIICPNFPKVGHKTHVHTKRTLEKARERAKGQDQHYRDLTARNGVGSMYSYYASEIGWKVQQQTVTEWETVHD